MNCPQCSNEMIKARATSFGEEYDYCRVCRKELKEMIGISDNTVAVQSLHPLHGNSTYTHIQNVSASNGSIISNVLAKAPRSFFNLCPSAVSHNIQMQGYQGNSLLVPLKCSLPQGRGSPASAIFSPSAQLPNIIVFSVPISTNHGYAPEFWIRRDQPGQSFYGVDRSVDPVRLAGVFYDGSALTIEEAITNALALLNREGGRPKHAFMNLNNYKLLLKHMNLSWQDHFDFKSVCGVTTVYPDDDCPPKRCYLISMDTWKKNPQIGAYCDQPVQNACIILS